MAQQNNTAISPPFVIVPRFLFTDSRFRELSSDAKLIYALLLDREALSQKNGWKDENGMVYIYYTVANLSEMINRSSMTVKRCMNDLVQCGLMRRIKQGFGRPSRIYVAHPDEGPILSPKTDQIGPSRGLNLISQEGTNLAPSKTNNSYTNKNQTKGEYVPSNAKVYGEYKNVYLTDEQYQALSDEFSDSYVNWIERLSEYMASTGKTYQNHLATIRRWSKNSQEPEKPVDYSYEKGESL